MAANFVIENHCTESQVCEIAFAGDGVRLAGQINYPQKRMPDGSPLVFILHHAGWRARKDYQHYVRTALNVGYATFLWDKRGTGRSGAGGRGSVVQDAVNAYETALAQPGINPRRVAILAQGEGSRLLGENFGLFVRLQRPAGVILIGNMLGEETITAIDAPLQIIQGERDWNTWQQYAQAAAATHATQTRHVSKFYVAHDADRELMTGGDARMFHFGAVHTIQDWLKTL
jgi:uncharacterized protein